MSCGGPGKLVGVAVIGVADVTAVLEGVAASTDGEGVAVRVDTDCG